MTGGTMKQMSGMAWALLLVAAPALGAQGKSPADTGRAAMMQRMETHMKKELGLTDDQAAKFHATHERFFPQHRDVMERGRAIREGLRTQLQPGVAANADSVRKLLDARQQNRAAMTQLERDMDRELAGYLTPVQRARLEMMHEHMMMHRGRGREPHGGNMRPGGEGQGDHDGEGEGDDDGDGPPSDQE
jgi:Spy/CpxP family protein refolding chaperone